MKAVCEKRIVVGGDAMVNFVICSVHTRFLTNAHIMFWLNVYSIFFWYC